MTTYEGTVVFTPDEKPFNGKYGPSYNAVVRFDEPDKVPDVDENGEKRIFKSADTADGRYIKTLQAGDRVSLAWVDTGKSQYYRFIIPANTPTGAKQQPKRQESSPQDQSVLEPLTNDDKETWKVAINNAAWMYQQALDLANALELGEDAARTIAGWARGMWRTGMVAQSTHAEPSGRDAFLDTIGDGEVTQEWVKATSEWFNTSGSSVVAAVKALGIQSSEWLDDDDSMWELAQIVGFWSDMVGQGASESVANTATAEEFGLNLKPDPIF